MKLRNKNTGDIWEFDEGFTMKASHETAERAGAVSGVLTCYAASLAELNRDWEDVPDEPLIKDVKITLTLEGDISDVEMFKDTIYSLNSINPYDGVKLKTIAEEQEHD